MKSRSLTIQIKKNLDLLVSGLLLFAFYSSLVLALPVIYVMDSRLLAQVLGYSNPTLDLVSRFLTEIGGMPFWILMAGFLWLRRERRAATFLIVGILADLTLASFLKVVFARPRPYEAMPEIKAIGKELGGSFPSGHTERTFVSALILSRFYKQWAWVLFGLGALVAFTRVYTANHYPLDAVAGAVNGLALGAATLRAPINHLQATLENYWARLTRRFIVLGELERRIASTSLDLRAQESALRGRVGRALASCLGVDSNILRSWRDQARNNPRNLSCKCRKIPRILLETSLRDGAGGWIHTSIWNCRNARIMLKTRTTCAPIEELLD